MRFATYEQHGRAVSPPSRTTASSTPPRLGLASRVQAGPEALLEAGNTSLDVPRGPHVSEVRLLPPLQPPTVRDFVTFEEHVEGVRRSIDGVPASPDAWYDAPTFYFTNPYAVIGAHDDVPVPPGCQRAGLRARGRRRHRPRGPRPRTPSRPATTSSATRSSTTGPPATSSRREMQVGLGPCKGKDTATTLGPYLVTADELEPYRDTDGFLRLALTAEINGEVVGQDLLSNMSWTFEEMIAYASRGTWVRPGDVLGSGTCGNGGCLAELWGVRGRQDPPPLKPGDTVTLTVEGIGTVSNTVVPGAEPVAVPRARTRPRTRP